MFFNSRYARASICGVLWLALLAGAAPADEPKSSAKGSADEVKALIHRLAKLDRPDTGYSGSVNGTAFIPLGINDIRVGLLGQQPNGASHDVKALVKLGPKALPALLEHLTDERPTKIVITSPQILTVERDDDENDKNDDGSGEKRYTVLVGDVCYVAIGQIVNRDYSMSAYIPSGIVGVISIPKCKTFRNKAIKEWSKLTPEMHRDSLLRDLQSTKETVRNGASLRLAYYYPEALEKPALKQLTRPTCSLSAVNDFVRNQLYAAKTAKGRKALVDDFLGKTSEVVREAIRSRLFDDLGTDEDADDQPDEYEAERRRNARGCLVDVFGLPPNVNDKDRPTNAPVDDDSQVRFIQTLHFDPSEKVDKALKDLMEKTNNDQVAKGCVDRLVGRGYDADIEAYVKRRMALLGDNAPQWLGECTGKLGWTRLHAAIDFGVPELVERALKVKVDVDARDRIGRTALHIACARGQTDLVELLLAAKANPNIKNEAGCLPVHYAAYDDDTDIVRQLIAKESETPDVFTASIVGAADRLATLLKDHPEYVKLRNNRGLALLHIASREGKVDAVRALLEAGAEVKAVDDDKWPHESNGWTALHLAAMNGQTTTAELLLDRDADVNARDRYLWDTPLHFAARLGKVDMVKLLLARKANREAKNKINQTPLDLAKESGHTAVIELLEK